MIVPFIVKLGADFRSLIAWDAIWLPDLPLCGSTALLLPALLLVLVPVLALPPLDEHAATETPARHVQQSTSTVRSV